MDQWKSCRFRYGPVVRIPQENAQASTAKAGSHLLLVSVRAVGPGPGGGPGEVVQQTQPQIYMHQAVDTLRSSLWGSPA